MSRVGKQIISLPQGVTLVLNGQEVSVKGPKGEQQRSVPACVMVSKENEDVTVTVKDPNEKDQQALWGTWASHIKNMVTGVSKGFQKELELNGVGYKVSLSGNTLTLIIGYSHPVEFMIPKGITAEVEKNIIRIHGIDKQLVGQVAAKIRSLRKVEPYKGKGIKYVGEHVRRKAGKAAKSAE